MPTAFTQLGPIHLTKQLVADMRYALQQAGAGIMEREKSTVLLRLSRSCRTGARYQSGARIRRPKDIQYIARMGYIPFGRIIRGGRTYTKYEVW